VGGTLVVQGQQHGTHHAKVDSAGRKPSLRGAWEPGAPTAPSAPAMTSRSVNARRSLTAERGAARHVCRVSGAARAVAAGAALPYEGYYTAAFEAEVLEVGSETLANRPEGFSFVTMTVSRAGKVKYSGVLADGARLSGSAMLMVFSGTEMQAMGYDVAEDAAYAAFPLYAPLSAPRQRVGADLDCGECGGRRRRQTRCGLDSSRWFYPGKSCRDDR
jgi:hypothetical protein